MKLLLDVQDKRAGFILELLHNLPGVKAKPLTAAKADLLESVAQGFKEMAQVHAGQLEGKPALSLLNEL